MSGFSITEGKYLLNLACDYDFDEIMQRDSWRARSWNGDADVKGYPPALEYVVFGTSKDAPEIGCGASEGLEIGVPEGLEIGFASAEYKEKIQRNLGEFMSERYGNLWLNALKTENWTVISGANIKDDKTLKYLAKTVGIVEAYAKNGTAVLDPMTYRLFTPEEWREKFFLPIRSRNFDPCAHAVIIIDKPRDKTKRARTLGMRKFGRPDLELIDDYSDTWEIADKFLIEFANRIMSFQVCGGFVENGGEIEDDYQFCIFKAVLDENLNDHFFHNMHITVDRNKCRYVDNPWIGAIGSKG